MTKTALVELEVRVRTVVRRDVCLRDDRAGSVAHRDRKLAADVVPSAVPDDQIVGPIDLKSTLAVVARVVALHAVRVAGNLDPVADIARRQIVQESAPCVHVDAVAAI